MNAATFAKELADARDLARYATPEDFACYAAADAPREAVRAGVELATIAVATALGLEGDARRAFYAAAGYVRSGV